MSNCPTCNTPCAYIGFMSVECVNCNCIHYCPTKQKENDNEFPMVHLYFAKDDRGNFGEVTFEGYTPIRFMSIANEFRYRYSWDVNETDEYDICGVYVTCEKKGQTHILYEYGFDTLYTVGGAVTTFDVDFLQETAIDVWKKWAMI